MERMRRSPTSARLKSSFSPSAPCTRGSTTKPISDGVLNFGFAERWELVLQITAQPLPEGAGPTSVPDAAFLKYVVQPGVLQDKKGPSVAIEFGPLLAGRRRLGCRL